MTPEEEATIRVDVLADLRAKVERMGYRDVIHPTIWVARDDVLALIDRMTDDLHC